MEINIQHFSIDNVGKSSGVFSGDNMQQRFTSKKIWYEGNGTLEGDHNIHMMNKHVIMKSSDKQDET
ncbi:hypothetical protein ACFFGV_11925 [Pontibacillus salicampi]|uniref:Uncharacterized protein n=1 Tax=Pontibacillus salicampi TaxID=1449801 RepID=A0ABV6LPD6_9BACI